MSHKILRPFIVKVSVLGYSPLPLIKYAMFEFINLNLIVHISHISLLV